MSTTTIKRNKYTITIGNTATKAIPANCAVLLKQKKDSYDFVAFTCKGTKPEELISAVLCGMVGEVKNAIAFNDKFGHIEVDKEDVKTGIKAIKDFQKFLASTSTVWKTSKDGKINRAIVMDYGTLKKTALYVTDKSPLCYATGKKLKALLHITCKAIVKQATMHNDVVKTAQGVYQVMTAKDKETKEEKTA